MSLCTLCPRNCNIDRSIKKGYCGMGNKIKIARAALHFWEEPCISGDVGSGTVFFSGCSLGCVYCQNKEISRGGVGKEITANRLTEIYFELQDKGAANINLVTGDHFIPQIVPTLEYARKNGLKIPVILNTSSYIKIDALKMLEGLVDIYLPDLKYTDNTVAKKYSKADDYFECASEAVGEMVRQVGKPIFDDRGYIKSGVIIRHLLLPNNVTHSKTVLKYIYETYKNDIYVSIMSQYTPCGELLQFPELNRKVTKREYEKLLTYAMDLGIENAFIQEGNAAKECFIPSFDSEGV